MTIAEQIRPLLTARDPRAVEGAADIAHKYHEQCRAINDRLARCSDYLRRGLRSEAVHLAECQPNVLQAAEDIQSPGAIEMERLYHSLGMTAPEEPNYTILEELRTACETEQSLAMLLAQHRTLAVGRAPLQQRLAVLYELAKRDPENQTWQNDIRPMEAERVKGIEREYRVAIREADLPALEKLGEEVTHTPWRKPLPRELVQRIQKSAHGVRRDARIKALWDLIRALPVARQSGDLVECARLLDEWHNMTTPAEARQLELPANLLTDGSDLMQSTGAWLTTQKRISMSRGGNPDRMAGHGNHLNTGQLNGNGHSDRSLLARFIAFFRFLAPERFRSPLVESEPAPRLLNGNVAADRHVR